MAERVLFDLNVLLDVIENRQPFIDYSGPALNKAANGYLHGFISATSVDTLAYILRKHTTSAQMYAIIDNLLGFLEVAPVTASTIQSALLLRWPDPEDAILYCAARDAGCTCIITRNVRDFRVDTINNALAILSPEHVR